MNPDIPAPTPEDEEISLTPERLHELRIKNLTQRVSVEHSSSEEIRNAVQVLREKMLNDMSHQKNPHQFTARAAKEGRADSLPEILATWSLSEKEIRDIVDLLTEKLITGTSPEDQVELERYQKRFPNGMPIIGKPGFFARWEEMIHYEQAAEKNHGQTLFRRSERGGFDPVEAVHLMYSDKSFTEVLHMFGETYDEKTKEKAFTYLLKAGIIRAS